MTRPAAGAGYRAVAFDLFGTLIEFEAARLPTLRIEGTSQPSTVPLFAARLARYVPGVDTEAFAAALRAVTEELRGEHAESLVEPPSRLRYRRALVRVGCSPDVLDEAAIVLSRAHHEAIGNATVFPPERRTVLARAAARGPVGLVSNFDDTASAFAILARHGILPLLHTVVVSEAIGLRKPHPATLATALHALDVEAGETLFVGDSLLADVGVAHAVGAHAAWIDHAGVGVPPDVVPPRHVLRRLEDLHAVFDAG
ncbi:MAG TPA: HAD family hydrolase [Candidatus Limnocylindria bacterium]|nr:HAD family hydrolase [Candidatus Limnocylindria bacterium]